MVGKETTGQTEVVFHAGVAFTPILGFIVASVKFKDYYLSHWLFDNKTQTLISCLIVAAPRPSLLHLRT